MSNIILPKPVGQLFSNFELIKFFNGYSSSSLCHYVAQTPGITHVTPTAYHDYIYENDWDAIYTQVKNLIDQHGIDDAAQKLHETKFSTVILKN